MDSTTRIALLIDADNVSVEVLRQVLHKLGLSGARLQHRRAYGSVQKAAEFAEVCRDHAIRFLPSTFAGPNATDIAMAIDAVELVLRQPVDEVVIASSDMDYSPLIVRLRELGCRVTGYGQQGKSGRDIERDYERVYDQFEVIGPARARPAARAPSRAAVPPRAGCGTRADFGTRATARRARGDSAAPHGPIRGRCRGAVGASGAFTAAACGKGAVAPGGRRSARTACGCRGGTRRLSRFARWLTGPPQWCGGGAARARPADQERQDHGILQEAGSPFRAAARRQAGVGSLSGGGRGGCLSFRTIAAPAC